MNGDEHILSPSNRFTVRAYIATQAMAAMCANSYICEGMTDAGMNPGEVRLSFAKSAVKQADALMAELNKEKE